MTESPTQITGPDVLTAVFDAGGVAVLGSISTAVFLSIDTRFGAGLAFLLTVIGVALAAGARYACDISAEGIRLTRYRAWIVPIRVDRYFLDSNFELYESFESDRPEGVFIHTLGIFEDDSDVFGPYFSESKMTALCQELQARLTVARTAASPPPKELRLSLLADQAAHLDVTDGQRTGGGRLRKVTVTHPITLGEISIPSGSVLHLNRDGFLDPQRPDTLSFIDCFEPVHLPNRLETGSEARLLFDDEGRLSSVPKGLEGSIVIDGRPVQGADGVSFDKEGRLSHYTLSAPYETGGITLPAGTRIHTTVASDLLPWTTVAWVSSPVILPELTVQSGDSLALDDDGRPVGVSPQRDITVEDTTYKHGIMPLPLTKNLRIDRKACLKYGLVKKA